MSLDESDEASREIRNMCNAVRVCDSDQNPINLFAFMVIILLYSLDPARYDTIRPARHRTRLSFRELENFLINFAR